MIGGRDVIIPTTAGSAAMELVLRAALRLWPRAVFEDAQTGDVLKNHGPLDLRGREEVLVYEDDNAAERWHDSGAEDVLANTMIHVLLRPDSITIVVDNRPSAAIVSLLSEIKLGLQQVTVG